jgi:hypothetical protein
MYLKSILPAGGYFVKTISYLSLAQLLFTGFQQMQTAKTINTIASFFIEIAMLVALALAGYQLSDAKWLQIIYAIALPLFVIILWAIWAAPKSASRLPRPALTIFKLALYAVTAALLYKAGYHSFAIVFAILAYINEFLAAAWDD